MKIIINASNLHIGGGVQVACSIIEELYGSNTIGHEYLIIVSSEIYESISVKNVDSHDLTLLIFDSHGFVGGLKNRKFLLSCIRKFKADVIYSVFGPTYLYRLPIPHIIGFANAWLVSPDCLAYSLMSIKQKSFRKIKYLFYKISLFFESDVFITETRAMKASLSQDKILHRKKVFVVSNCHSNIYLDSGLWQSIDLPIKNEDVTLCTISSDYLHKNLQIIPSVAKVLQDKYNIKARFIVTIEKSSYESKGQDFKMYTFNLGPISPSQCPHVYNHSDMLFMPTLLETFSASYPEAMVMHKPIITSDLSFARDICGDAAFYFSPLDPHSIAESIYECFSDDKKRNLVLNKGKLRLNEINSSSDRLSEILSIIEGYFK